MRLTPLQQKSTLKQFQNFWHFADKKEKPRLLNNKPPFLREIFSPHLTAFTMKNMPVDLQNFLSAVKTPYPEYSNYFEFTRNNADIFVFCRNIYDKLRQRQMAGLVGTAYFDEFYFPRQRVIFMNSYYNYNLSCSLGALYFYASFVVHEARHKLDQNLSRIGKLDKFFTTYLEPLERRANIEQLRFAITAEKVFPDLSHDPIAHDLRYLDIMPEIEKYNQSLHLEKDNVELEYLQS
ncbi:hypothetical protein NO1_0728 [Candidatus Termititenax aidoneus]|uniref:Uncharacterized protein n=1 Tax=Termititenax aidoneus TaxID=2218524 RepID=A0A388T9M6_TERA1|nr:hypothetical protein NO1_0728 [Candidatus Termititenax aidoneus]